MASFKMGNMDEGVSDRTVAERFLRANVTAKPECVGCWAKFFCSGGCHANAWNHTGSLEQPYRIGCELQKKRIECAIYIKTVLEERGIADHE